MNNELRDGLVLPMSVYPLGDRRALRYRKRWISMILTPLQYKALGVYFENPDATISKLTIVKMKTGNL